MKKVYQVEVPKIHTHTYYVQAETSKEAKEIVRQMSNGVFRDECVLVGSNNTPEETYQGSWEAEEITDRKRKLEVLLYYFTSDEEYDMEEELESLNEEDD